MSGPKVSDFRFDTKIVQTEPSEIRVKTKIAQKPAKLVQFKLFDIRIDALRESSDGHIRSTSGYSHL